MIRANQEIKGIKIDIEEYIINQYADDTNFTLDGSENSFLATIDTLIRFARLSGLKVNFDKTSAIWIGSKKYNRKRYMPEYKIKWNPDVFKILGIKFSVDLPSMY